MFFCGVPITENLLKETAARSPVKLLFCWAVGNGGSKGRGREKQESEVTRVGGEKQKQRQATGRRGWRHAEGRSRGKIRGNKGEEADAEAMAKAEAPRDAWGEAEAEPEGDVAKSSGPSPM